MANRDLGHDGLLGINRPAMPANGPAWLCHFAEWCRMHGYIKTTEEAAKALHDYFRWLNLEKPEWREATAEDIRRMHGQERR